MLSQTQTIFSLQKLCCWVTNFSEMGNFARFNWCSVEETRDQQVIWLSSIDSRNTSKLHLGGAVWEEWDENWTRVWEKM